MSGDDNSFEYAPKSPDLSSFYSGGPTQPASQQLHPPRDDHKLHPPAAAAVAYDYAPDSSSSPASYAPPIAAAGHHSHHHHHQHQHQHPPQYGLEHQQQAIKSEFASSYSSPPPPLPLYGQPPYLPPGAQHSAASPPYTLQAPGFQQHHLGPYGEPSSSHHFAGHPLDQSSAGLQQPPQQQALYHPEPGPLPHQASPLKLEPDMPPRRAAAAPPPPAIEPSPVRTKFPTARIKRIMQADEEVGKVAQQTPIAVGKALELFMIQLVTKSADVAKEKGSKRVTAPMLKQVVETDDQWDFLREIVSRVENEKEGSKSKAKAESESDEEFSEPKKRSRAGGARKKKA
ncbi:histone-fold domain-containing protein [Purpureocillium lavendulum]|uniref:NCT transcriptional regulatory complex subunit A n=1 Tax=Purpureocillium lavendulum TaxID=1247861 RepID=A0AB34G0D4_9HYPO|nr:histone-fold domain-containing protein [Purpureocillium lavendulum]